MFHCLCYLWIQMMFLVKGDAWRKWGDCGRWEQSVIKGSSDTRKRWTGYFEWVLNVDVRQVSISVVGDHRKMSLFEHLNEWVTTNKKYKKHRKGTWVGWFLMFEDVYCGKGVIIETIESVFFANVISRPVWWKGIGDRYECSNQRAICLLHVSGNIW